MLHFVGARKAFEDFFNVIASKVFAAPVIINTTVGRGKEEGGGGRVEGRSHETSMKHAKIVIKRLS